MRSKEEIQNQLNDYQNLYNELCKQGGKDSPVDTQMHFRKLAEINSRIDTLKWVLEDINPEKCSHHDCAQGRHWCTTPLHTSRRCDGVCEFYEEKREYNKIIEGQDYGDLMTVEEWNQAVKDGMFIDSDGSGYWVKDNRESDDEVFGTPQLDATHVMWYNK